MANIRVVDLDVTTPIDTATAIAGLGGEPSIFYEMLGSLEDMTLNECMKKMVPVYDTKNYDEIKSHAHALKGASAYIGASRLHYMCYFIQHYYVEKDYPRMIKYYPCLVEAAIEFKTYSRQIIAVNNGKS